MNHFYKFFVLFALAFSVECLAFEKNNLVFEIIEGTTNVSVAPGEGDLGNLVIPETVEYDGVTYTVTEIGQGAFSGRDDLTAVTIPETMMKIGFEAFTNCSSLTTVYYNATNCMTITAYNDSRQWNRPFFAGSDNFTDLIIGDNVEYIPMYLFDYCKGLTDVTIPDNVTCIGDMAFEYSENIKNFIVGNGVKVIGRKLFGKANTQTQTIPDASVTFGESVVAIAMGSKLKEPSSLPNSLVFIGENAFYCPIAIPESVTYIDSNPTAINQSQKNEYGVGSYLGDDKNPYHCLVSINDNTITSFFFHPDCGLIYRGVNFSKCTSLQYNKFDNALYLGSPDNPYFCLVRADNKEIESCVINDKCRIICEGAFSECGLLASITIPESVKSIGRSAFSACANLSEVVIPQSITCLPPYIFANCQSLSPVVIPNSVVCIGESAFSRCKSLTSIALPPSLSFVDVMAFSGINKDVVVTIPKSVVILSWDGTNYPYIGSNVYCEAERIPCTWSPDYSVFPHWSCKVVRTSTENPKIGKVTIEGKNYAVQADDGSLWYLADTENGEVTVTAVATDDHPFLKWSDGVDEVSRTESVTKSETYKAIFAHNFVNYIYNDDATLEADGTETAHCEYDGCEATDTRTAEGTRLQPNPTQTETIPEDAVSISVIGNSIVVCNSSDDVSVYDIAGHLVARSGSAPRNVITFDNKGVYIVKTGKDSELLKIK